MEEISLPSTLKSIGMNAIPTSVKSLDLPDNITDAEFFTTDGYISVTVKENSTTFKTLGFTKDSLPVNVHLK